MSFSEQLFLLSYQLCKEFPAFTPLDIECEKYHRVVALYSNVRKIQIREQKRGEPTKIRRKAGNDWF